jgi:4-oxalocrotonate tautomerase family enzyme
MPTVILYWSPGRTDEQKKAVIEGITDVLVQKGGARQEDVLIIFQNLEHGDFGRAGKVGKPPQLNTD